MSDWQKKRKISPTQALRDVERLAHRIRDAATRLPEEGRSQRVQQSERDFWFFGRTYFPHHFTRQSAACHYELIESWQDAGVEVDRLPRGWAKTTLAQIFVLWSLLFGKRKFAINIGKSDETAAEFALTMVLELEENERIRQDFGEQQSGQWSLDKGFRLKSSGCWFLSLGRGVSIRGRKKGAARPDLIFADDIEDEELVRNSTRIKRLLHWWLSSVLGSLAEGGTAIWLGTSLGEKSSLNLLLDPDWKYEDAEEPPYCRRRSFAARNPEGESSWPDLWPDERLKAKEAEMGSIAFNKEFMNMAEPSGAMFRWEWMKFYDGNVPKGVMTVMSVDPSARSEKTSNCKAVGVWSKDLFSEDYFCREAWIRKATIDKMCYEIVRQWTIYRPEVCIFEINGYQELVMERLLQICRELGIAILIHKVETKINKEVRIQRLQPLAENGKLHFIRRHSDQDTLMEQFCYFPSSTVDDDGPDMSEMAIEYLRPFSSNSSGRKYQRVRERSRVGEIL